MKSSEAKRPAWVAETLNATTWDKLRPVVGFLIGAAVITIAMVSMASAAPAVTCDQRGCSDWKEVVPNSERVSRRNSGQDISRPRRGHRFAGAVDANGNVARVRSLSGVVIKVAPSARQALQCVVDYVESHGVKIKYMRGYGSGTVRGSLHPSGRAIDINQTARNVTRPAVPRAVSNAAADHCGVISGARWGYADNGHWNLIEAGRPSEPWPRVLQR